MNSGYFSSHFTLKTKAFDRNRARPNQLFQSLRVGKVPNRIPRDGGTTGEGAQFQAKKGKIIIVQISPDPQ